MPIHAPKIEVLGVKVGENGNFCSFIRLGMQSPGTNALRIKQRKNRLCGFGSRHEQKFGHKKINARVIFHPFAQTTSMGLSI